MDGDGDEISVAVERHCAAQHYSTLDFPFGDNPTVYKVGGRMFALLDQAGDPARLSVKLPPEVCLELRAQYPKTVLPGYHLNKIHWNTLLLDGVLDLCEVLECVDQSYALVRAGLPGRVKAALAATGNVEGGASA